MWRRIYVSFPTAAQTRRVVDELKAFGVAEDQMHALARPGVDIDGLPRASEAQRGDQVWTLEQAFWYGNLALFAVALVLAVWALFQGAVGWAVVAILAAIATVVIGERFVVTLPHAHLNQLRVPYRHGEVILLVDVPHEQLREVEQLVSRRHPEAGVGGVGWTLQSGNV